MGDLKQWHKVLEELPFASCQQMQSEFSFKHTKINKPYWEAKSWFLNDLFQLLGCSNEDTFIDMFAGQGLAALQMAFQGTVGKVLAVEEDLRRNQRMWANVTKFQEACSKDKRVFSEISQSGGNSLEPWLSDQLKKNVIVYAAYRDDAAITAGMRDILSATEPGSRVVSNIPLTTFDVSSGIRSEYQVIEVSLDQLIFDSKQKTSDERAQQAAALKKKLATPRATRPNTTMSDNFVKFYIHTKKNWTQPHTHATKTTWPTNATGFAPIQIGKKWICFHIKVLMVKGQYRRISLVLPETGQLSCELSVPASELFKLEAECQAAIMERNSIIRDPSREGVLHLRQQYQTSPTPLSFVLKQVLPRNLSRAINATVDNIKLIGDDGINEDGLRFDVFRGAEVNDYISDKNPLLQVPVFFIETATQHLGIRLPDESLTEIKCLPRSIIKNKSFPVVKTDETNFQALFDSMTVEQANEYFKDDRASRLYPLAMTSIPVSDEDEGLSLQPPAFLANSDLTLKLDNLPRKLTKHIDMIGADSFLRFHCHEDASLVWLTVKKGWKLCFFLMNPTEQDYDYMAQCSDKRHKKKFIADTMVGRVFARILFPGQSVVFPGSIPHAYYSGTDTLAYGGRYVVTAHIPRMIKFGEESMLVKCRGYGYSFPELKSILYQSRRDVFETCWKWKCSGTHHNAGIEVIEKLADLFASNLKVLKINNEQWECMRAWFTLVKTSHGTNLQQSVCGVFFDNSRDDLTERSLNELFRSGAKVPILANTTTGELSGCLDPCLPGDLDYADPASKRNLTSYSTDVFLAVNYCTTPSALFRDGLRHSGMFSLTDLDSKHLVSTYNGFLRSYDDMIRKYGSVNFGSAYKLQSCKRGRKMATVFVDANKYGGMSLFIRTSKAPNCDLIPAVVGSRVVLTIVTNQPVIAGDELFIPEPEYLQRPTTLPVQAEDLLDIARSNLPSAPSTGSDPEKLVIDENVPQTGSKRKALDDITESFSSPESIAELRKTRMNPAGVKRITTRDVRTAPVSTSSQTDQPEAPHKSTSQTDVSVGTMNEVSSQTDAVLVPAKLANKSTGCAPNKAALKSYDTSQTSPRTPSPPPVRPITPTPPAIPSENASPDPGPSTRRTRSQRSCKVNPKPIPKSKLPKAKPTPKQAATCLNSSDSSSDDENSQEPGPSARITRSRSAKSKVAPRVKSGVSRESKSTPRKGKAKEKEASSDQPEKKRMGRKPGHSKKYDLPESTSSSDDEVHPLLSGSGKEMTFLVNGRVIRKANIKEIPNAQSREAYDQLEQAAKDELKHINCGRWYKEFEDYHSVNLKLRELYNKADLIFCCAVCAHIGMPIERHKQTPFYQFYSFDTYKTHWLRHHKNPVFCPICGETFLSARWLHAHNLGQDKKPNSAHSKHNDKQNRKEERAKLREEAKKSSK